MIRGIYLTEVECKCRQNNQSLVVEVGIYLTEVECKSVGTYLTGVIRLSIYLTEVECKFDAFPDISLETNVFI